MNGNWLTSLSSSFGITLPCGLSDHSPIGINLGLRTEKIYKPFQFFNHLIQHKEFLTEVYSAGNFNVIGNPWFVLTTKIKRVKEAMRKLNSRSGNVHSNVFNARNALIWRPILHLY